MKNLYTTYPKYSKANKGFRDELGSSKPGSINYRFEGLGDYKFSKRVKPSVGARVGAWLGDRGQRLLKRFTGLGDYSTDEQAGVAPIHGLDPPIMQNASKRANIVSHREYIGDVISGAAGSFSLQSFKINPGNPSTFPWLAAIAANYQQYRLNGCVFEFKTTSADSLNSTNTALGQIIMATNYNVVQPNFQSKYEMENTEFANSCKPSSSMFHAIECAPSLSVLTDLYVAPQGLTPAGQPEQFVNFANFQIATNGLQAANVNLGELWVTYEFILLKPIVPAVSGQAQGLSLHYSAASASSTTSMVSGPPFASLIPSTALSYHADPDPLMAPPYYLSVAGNTVTIQCAAGDQSLIGRAFRITTLIRAEAAVVVTANPVSMGTIADTTNCVALNRMVNDSISYQKMPATSTPTVVGGTAIYTMGYEHTFKVTGAGPIVITYGNLTFPTYSTPTQQFLDVRVSEIPDI